LNLKKENYETPTPIQMQCIPVALEGRDILASAPTGSGKTAAFVLPAIHHVEVHNYTIPKGYPLVLILGPTRELCMQIEEQMKSFSVGLPLKTGLVVGGLPMPTQVYRLNKGVQVIIATPGRLIEILSKHEIHLETVSMVIMDEVDVMLNMGFDKQVSQIMQHIRPNHQTLMFSATIPRKIEDMGRETLKNPILISVGDQRAPASSVKQIVMWVETEIKKKKLFEILEDKEFYNPPVVVFVDSRMGADLLAEAILKLLD